ncbi:Chemotaxis response regulator protein-glutamate methylesterase CheB [hydrothermal vent metagenome]|uniref:protein-glutamate methylesterase n=1 Tax=hydrothermal vent metagenome TaxID=652676 RepID=A0A3B0XUT6_9ZZZZ
MAVKVLIVDDSGFFRRRVSDMLKADSRFTVVGVAVDGYDAIKQTKKLKPDVITMDIEMPVMDGITAVRKIMQEAPVPILMFSSLTREGAKATFDAMDAGAIDYLPKNFEDISKNSEEVARLLRSRIWNIGVRGLPKTRLKTSASAPKKTLAPKNIKQASATSAVIRPSVNRTHRNKLVIIGASTGGPVALQNVVEKLSANYHLPVLMVQHMPASFTGAFADRLNSVCAIEVREAKHGDVLKPGLVLLAPGGVQTLIENRSGKLHIRINSAEVGVTYKPCIDLTLKSVANSIGGDCTTVILTGMGSDGRDGAKELKVKGGEVWAQDEQSSVIYGMPMAIKKAGIADKELTLDDIGPALVRLRA